MQLHSFGFSIGGSRKPGSKALWEMQMKSEAEREEENRDTEGAAGSAPDSLAAKASGMFAEDPTCSGPGRPDLIAGTGEQAVVR